jgi:hypothetical protein
MLQSVVPTLLSVAVLTWLAVGAGSCRLEWGLLATCTTAAKNAWLELSGPKAGSVTGRVNVVVRVIHFQHLRHKHKQGELPR